jgi:hypothetical protein
VPVQLAPESEVGDIRRVRGRLVAHDRLAVLGQLGEREAILLVHRPLERGDDIAAGVHRRGCLQRVALGGLPLRRVPLGCELGEEVHPSLPLCARGGDATGN